MGYGNYTYYYRFVLWSTLANVYTFLLIVRAHSGPEARYEWATLDKWMLFPHVLGIIGLLWLLVLHTFLISTAQVNAHHSRSRPLPIPQPSNLPSLDPTVQTTIEFDASLKIDGWISPEDLCCLQLRRIRNSFVERSPYDRGLASNWRQVFGVPHVHARGRGCSTPWVVLQLLYPSCSHPLWPPWIFDDREQRELLKHPLGCCTV